MPAALLIPSVLKNPECQMFRLTAMYCPVTLFDDGLCLLTPTLIFRGKGFRMSKGEKSTWDKRVKVLFQEKAWYDENVMKNAGIKKAGQICFLILQPPNLVERSSK